MLVAFAEWPHYRQVVEWKDLKLGSLDTIVLQGVLWAKTQVLLLPVLWVSWLLDRRGFRRLARMSVILSVGSILLFILLDLWTQIHFGTNLSSYWSFISDALLSLNVAGHGQWAGDLNELLVSIVWFIGPWIAGLSFLLIASSRVVSRCISLETTRNMVPVLLAGHTALVLAAILAQAEIEQRTFLQRLDWVLPLPSAERLTYSLRSSLVARAATLPSVVQISSLVPQPNFQGMVNPEINLRNLSAEPVSLQGWRIKSLTRDENLNLSGTIESGATLRIPVDTGKLTLPPTGDHIALINTEGTVLSDATYDAKDVDNGSLIVFPDRTSHATDLSSISEGLRQTYESALPDLRKAAPLDTSDVLAGGRRPNVLWIVIDSLRHQALTPELMPRMSEWSRRGLTLTHHYAESNTSHLGMFALLYARSPVVYETTLDAHVPPQAVVTFKRAGYQTHYYSIGGLGGWKRMEEYVNGETFDDVDLPASGTEPDWHDWPQGDTRLLERARQVLQTGDHPHFVVVFLMSLHYPYPSPPSYQQAVPLSLNGGDAGSRIEELRRLNRAATGFLDDAIWNVVSSLDPKNNLVLVTGDHGEALLEDGALAHGSRPSDIQMHVPISIVGPGIKPSVIDRPTVHSDILPTLVHALTDRRSTLTRTHGRDLLADFPEYGAVLLKPLSRKEPGHLVLMRPKERLLVEYSSTDPTIEALGFIDEAGYPRPADEQSLTPASLWIAAFREQMLRLTSR
jgi:hypothetical protein